MKKNPAPSKNTFLVSLGLSAFSLAVALTPSTALAQGPLTALPDGQLATVGALGTRGGRGGPNARPFTPPAPLNIAANLTQFPQPVIGDPNAKAGPVSVRWLDGAPAPVPVGVSWGVPWPRGQVPKTQAFTLTNANGTAMPLQTWPLAYWPDGSLKWTGFATVASAADTGNFTLTPVPNAPAQTGQVKATDAGGYVQIDTGALKCVISKTGSNLIDWMAIDGPGLGYAVVQNAQLVCILQTGADNDPLENHPREKFISAVKKVTLEQSGPVRAVVKIEGMHKGVTSGREWLPFSVRLYFYSGETAVRLVHTIVFDGKQDEDFIRGLGVTFTVPMREEIQNRHVRFSGEGDGLWGEPIQAGGGNAAQFAGQPIGGGPNYGENGAYAIWNDFRLIQPTPDGFTIEKRTNPQSTWLFVQAGKRASGLAFVGDTSGGLGVVIKNFWQSFPDGYYIQNARTQAAQLTAWLWSPDAPEMDMRHYDTIAHGLGPTYEDVQPGMSTAYGIGRTGEMTLFPSANVPSRPQTVAMALTTQWSPMLAASPQYIHSTGVFGAWSLQDRSTPFKAAIEDGLDSLLSFYEGQVDQRSWYGFWHYGDFMHSYNNSQHEWNYDWGGHAWDNTELGVPLWLWYSYLRTGRADLYRLAEAHTRNTSETNVYHLGPMMGLGTRHNVIKWGDGAKEARISQDAHWRPYYYLSTDERVGDIMRDNLQADVAVGKFDPMRIAFSRLPNDPVNRIRVGPDWLALTSNWMTEWERTGDTKWRDRILTGAHDLAKMPYGIRSGENLVMGWDPVDGHLTQIYDGPGNYNLATIQGGGEQGLELSSLLADADWQRVWLQYARLLGAPREVVLKDNETHTEDGSRLYGNGGGNADSIPRLAGYAYLMTKNPAYAQTAIAGIAGGRGGAGREVSGPDSLTPVTEGLGDTNGASQSSLNKIEVLELAKDQLPTEAPVGGGGGRRGAGAFRGAGPAAGNPAAGAPPAAGN